MKQDNLHNAFEKGEELSAIYLDINKASDWVWQNGLFHGKML
jgi:hypothetical protein